MLKKEVHRNFVKALDKVTKRYSDNLLLRTAIQALPYVGGPIDTLLSGKASKIQQARIECFLDETNKKLQTIEKEKIDYEFIESEEFFSIFQNLLEKVIRTYEKEKIEIFSNIFVNSIVKENSKTYYKEGFIDMVFNLSALHIKILRFFYHRHNVLRSLGIEYTSVDEISKELGLGNNIQAEKFCNDLMRYGLIYDWGVGRYNYVRGRYSMTPYASHFVKFILEKQEA